MRQALEAIGVQAPSSERAIQIRCPFHGNDLNPSARLYEDGLYCWVCHRTFTPVSIIATHHEISYGAARALITEQFGPTMPVHTKSTRQRLDTAFVELLECIELMQNEDRQIKARSAADVLLKRSARGDSEIAMLKQIDILMGVLYPNVVGVKIDA